MPAERFFTLIFQLATISTERIVTFLYCVLASITEIRRITSFFFFLSPWYQYITEGWKVATPLKPRYRGTTSQPPSRVAWFLCSDFYPQWPDALPTLSCSPTSADIAWWNSFNRISATALFAAVEIIVYIAVLLIADLGFSGRSIQTLKNPSSQICYVVKIHLLLSKRVTHPGSPVCRSNICSPSWDPPCTPGWAWDFLDKIRTSQL